jgi:hypothetical protein
MILDPITIRDTLRGVLMNFACVDRQLIDQFSAGELYCQWFDDTYHPDVKEWRLFFSETELKAMADFTEILNSHSSFIARKGSSELIGESEWDKIVQSAKKTLNSFGST